MKKIIELGSMHDQGYEEPACKQLRKIYET